MKIEIEQVKMKEGRVIWASLLVVEEEVEIVEVDELLLVDPVVLVVDGPYHIKEERREKKR